MATAFVWIMSFVVTLIFPVLKVSRATCYSFMLHSPWCIHLVPQHHQISKIYQYSDTKTNVIEIGPSVVQQTLFFQPQQNLYRKSSLHNAESELIRFVSILEQNTNWSTSLQIFRNGLKPILFHIKYKLKTYMSRKYIA